MELSIRSVSGDVEIGRMIEQASSKMIGNASKLAIRSATGVERQTSTLFRPSVLSDTRSTASTLG